MVVTSTPKQHLKLKKIKEDEKHMGWQFSFVTTADIVVYLLITDISISNSCFLTIKNVNTYFSLDVKKSVLFAPEQYFQVNWRQQSPKTENSWYSS